MKKLSKWAALAAVLVLCASCDTMRSLMVDGGAADQLLANGVISVEQHAALTGNGWGPLLQGLINTVSTLVIGVPVIRAWRGPATKAENVAKKVAAKVPPAPAASEPPV